MMFVKTFLERLYNYLGWKSSRKLLVITSDDWGSVRIASSKNRKNLENAGFEMDGNRFNKFDSLESNLDLELLHNSLRKFKDSKGNHPVITALTNVANPDFDKIAAHDFAKYFYEPFSQTLKSYPNHDKVLELYKQGITENIFVPEFHGREHIHIARWMKALQSGDKNTRFAFEQRFYTPDQAQLPKDSKGFSAAFDLDSTAEIAGQNQIVKSGLSLFEELFGYRATLFTAPSLLYNVALEKQLAEEEIKIIDVAKIQKMPIGNNKFKSRLNYFGKKNNLGQLYITRNAVFEPNISTSESAINSCLQDISKAFRNNQPAIISNHRAAFVGSIDSANRTSGLEALEELLTKILQKWPNVEFVSAAQLNQIIRNAK